MKPNPLEAFGRDHPWVVGVASTPEVLFADAEGLASACDILEVRVDLLEDGLGVRRRVHELGQLGLPVLITVRGTGEGGKFSGTDEERLEHYEVWGEVASMFDVELGAGAGVLSGVRSVGRKHGALTMASFHDFQQTPSTEALEVLIGRAREAEMDAVKLAVTLRGPSDLERMEALVGTPRNFPVCVVGMGHLGYESRVSLPGAGSWLTYGFLGSANAPGQPAANELVEALRIEVPSYGLWRGGSGGMGAGKERL
ncbi:MAG TPA: type I 3-dehydroquinate dehydratase [Kiritimatiellia bacterium]|nr:type I 3-dehydroquinate dehydratase [Kiritimatiellia bacterium]